MILINIIDDTWYGELCGSGWIGTVYNRKFDGEKTAEVLIEFEWESFKLKKLMNLSEYI